MLRWSNVLFPTPASMLPEALRFQDAGGQAKGNPEASVPETVQQQLHQNLMALTCRELIVMLGEYRDRTLASAERASAEAHLLSCDECTAYLKSYEQTIRLGKRAFREAVDSEAGDLPETTIQEILRVRARTQSRAPR
jgi:anti-sigma factor RsiW